MAERQGGWDESRVAHTLTQRNADELDESAPLLAVGTLAMSERAGAFSEDPDHHRPFQQPQSETRTTSTVTSNWMEELKESLEHRRLTRLLLPGAHDAGAFDLEPKISPDLTMEQGRLVSCLIGSCCNAIGHAWGETQLGGVDSSRGGPFSRLLHAGVRYFDLRIALDNAPGLGQRHDARRFKLCHGIITASAAAVTSSPLAHT